MNPILEQIVQGIEAKVSPENKDAFERAVLAGKKILFDKNTHSHMELIKNPQSRKDPVTTISTGVTGLAWTMYRQSKSSMPPEVLIMSAVVIMCEALDFAERGLGIQLDNDMVAATSKKLAANLFTKLGIQPDQLQEAINKGKGEIDDHHAKQSAASGAPGEMPAPAGLMNAPPQPGGG